MATKKTRTKKEKAMPKLDPDDQSTTATTVAPAPLPAGQTSTSGFGSPAASTATTGGFGSATTATTGFGSAGGNSAFGSTPAGGFGSASSGFGSTPSTGASSFGSSSSGFGGSSGGFGSSGGGFGGGMSGGMGGGMQNQQSTAEAANAFGGIMAAQAAAGAPEEHWMSKYWRPAMGWLYMLICFMDFCVFPMLSMFLPVIERMFGLQMGYVPWQSLTLSNGGLIHLAFGAILGVSAYGRTKEKTSGV